MTHSAGTADTQCRKNRLAVQLDKTLTGGADTVHEEQTPSAGGEENQWSRSRHPVKKIT